MSSWLWFLHTRQFRFKLPLMEAVNWGGFPLFKQHREKCLLQTFPLGSLLLRLRARATSQSSLLGLITANSMAAPCATFWEGRIHLIPGDVVHRNLFRWLWPNIVLIELVEFFDYFNNKRTRKQHKRKLPSGVAPNVVFDMPGGNTHRRFESRRTHNLERDELSGKS
ncbi:hypothetical protein B0H14DRAFT_3135519, partial [Mycena olivaceomarginata]